MKEKIMAADLATVLDLEFVVWQGRNCLPLAMDKKQAAIGLEADQKRLYAALDTLSDDELRAFAAYRKINKWW
jgi:hypothetical protein